MAKMAKLSFITCAATLLCAGMWLLQSQQLWVSADWPLEKLSLSLALVFCASFLSWVSAAFNQSLQENRGIGRILRLWLSVNPDKRVPESDWVTWMLHVGIWMMLPIVILRQWGLTDTSHDLFLSLIHI